jgi:large subunit ribosomal protein L25
MNEILLPVKTRARVGGSGASQLRREGQIPAVVYGRGGTRPLKVEYSSFLKVWKHAGQSSIVTIEEEGQGKTPTLIQAIQRDPRTDVFLHVDFLELTRDHAITAPIPLNFQGEPIGVRTEDGVLDVHSHTVEVKCLPADLPHQIDVDIENLHAGDILHIGGLPQLPGVEYTSDPEVAVVSIGQQKVRTTVSEEGEPEGEAAEAGEGTAAAEGESPEAGEGSGES